ncbi:MAG: hypothetical protein HY718_11635 [Planctomycetes bacterium]|nr:hypothetical protein [Planctomycetota bacterium]
MPRPPVDLHQKIPLILEHTIGLPAEAVRPLAHHERSANDAFNLLGYLRRLLERVPKYEAVYERHMGHLRRMVLVSLIESFERLLKELAAVCIDSLVNYVADDRFDRMGATGGQIAVHFGAGTVGKALCESDTWLSNRTVNERFRSLLRDPFGSPWEEYVFPDQGQKPVAQQPAARTLAVLWQVRHTITHNVGMITRSDGIKLKLLLRRDVSTDCILAPTEDDLRYVKRFLSDLGRTTNDRIAQRLAAILTILHQQSPMLLDAQAQADALSKQFGLAVTIDGMVGQT